MDDGGEGVMELPRQIDRRQSVYLLDSRYVVYGVREYFPGYFSCLSCSGGHRTHKNWLWPHTRP
jgi:hypothetical protein